MSEPEEVPTPEEGPRDQIFMPAWEEHNRPARIVSLGHYYPKKHTGKAEQLLRETRATYNASSPVRPRAIRQNLGWTELINALNQERQWPLKRLFELMDPMLEADIAIAAVPTHIAYQAFWPMRTLAQSLAAHGRVDATSCLVRTRTIRRITFGGPSTRALHRQTLRLENAHLVTNRRVLLLDDIAKSGASLTTCREMLYEAGAALVQAMALGWVIVEGHESE